MKKLCTLILVLILAMSMCLTACDLVPTPNKPEGGESTESASATGTDAPSENGTVGEKDSESPDSQNPDAETDGEDTPEELPDILPEEKTPAAWYDAAYRTVSELTNGTLTFKMVAVSGTLRNEMSMTVTVSGENYIVTENEEDHSESVIYADGIAYFPDTKTAEEIPAEEFCNAYLPYYPLSNAMLPLTEDAFEGVSFREENGEVIIEFSISAQDFSEIIDSPSTGLKEMLCKVSFKPNGVMKAAVFTAIMEMVNEKTGETVTSSNEMSVILSELGTVAPITAPEDAEEYEMEEDDGENIILVPTMQEGNDHIAINPGDKDPSFDNGINLEELYETEMKLGEDLNKDGFIGAPSFSAGDNDENGDKEPDGDVLPMEPFAPEEIYNLEIELKQDINGDGVIGKPENPEDDAPSVKDEANADDAAPSVKDEANADEAVGVPDENGAVKDEFAAADATPTP